MKRPLAVAVGIVAGLLLSGIVAPMMIVVLPPRLRGESLILAAGALIVAFTTYVSWTMTSDR
jgi:hypothetical protein